jgi:hypothetical protein
LKKATARIQGELEKAIGNALKTITIKRCKNSNNRFYSQKNILLYSPYLGMIQILLVAEKRGIIEYEYY